MSDGVLLSGAWAKRLIAGLATVGAVALTVEGTIGQPQPTPNLRGAIPQNLRPDEYVVGVPWTGEPGKVVGIAELEAASAREPKIAGPIERRHEQSGSAERLVRAANPAAPLVARWPFAEPSAAARERGGPSIAFTGGTAFNAISIGESGFVPPDSNGAVGPAQIMVVANGRFKIFDKTGGLVASFTDNALFASVITSGAVGVSDPHVRYDRTSGHWFISEIDIVNTSNRILLAVSSGSSITSSASFTTYSFKHDAPGITPNIDSGHFADYDTLGVDANAVYIGVNEFPTASTPGGPQNTSAYVIRKSSVIGGGPLVVTAFRGLATNSAPTGAWTPQGVQNDDPSATEGYFIGVDYAVFSKLDVHRVTTPGATPALSGVMEITVPSTYFPLSQPAPGATTLDALDDRLFAAELRTNRVTGVQTLWTAHNIRVNNTGVGGSGFDFDRNASRWYEIGNLTTTPSLVQAGTVFDNGAGPLGFWIPSIVMNGQGHAVLAGSYANYATAAGIFFSGRHTSDGAGTMTNPGPTALALGSGGYFVGSDSTNRWGDYSQTVVDPNDDMTVWTFQEYASATNTWTVRATRLNAPPPPTPIAVSPSIVPKNTTANITISASAPSGQAFFDPGPAFPARPSITFTGGVTANSITVVDATHAIVNITTTATTGSVDFNYSNPDGQSISASGLFTVVAGIVGDFDGDAKADMTLYQPDGTWKFRRSNTSYVESTLVGLGGAGYTPVPGDYDGDGRIDPAVYNTTTGMWLAKESSTSYATTFTQSWGGAGYLPEPGDYDGDGKTDLGLYVQSTGQWLLLQSGAGYTTSFSVSWGGTGYTAVSGRDFDGDGKSDIAVYRESTGYWYVLKSSTNFTDALIVGWGGHGYTLVPGDYDGDGRADLGLYERATGWWYILESIGGYTTPINVNWGGPRYDPVPGNYDGDRKMDIAVVQRSTGNWYVLESSTSYATSFAVTGWGASSDALVSDAIPVTASDMTRATDFDADGKADITIYSSAGTWLSLTSSTAYAGSFIKSWGGAGYTAAPGDFDGDGKVDLSLYQNATGTWLVLLSGEGYTTSLSRSAGGDPYVPVVGDYDGDGKSDFAVYNGSTGNWYVLKSTTGYTAMSINWGGTGYAPAPGDYDGDGKTDLGLYQQSSGNWYVLLSSSHYTTSLSRNAGGPGYTAAAGDYDGDGKTDFVAYNGSTGLWSGLTSSSGYTTTLSVSWGGPGYQTVQGDYDGDGKVDLALYQTSTGLWSILLSGSGYTTTLGKSWGGAGYTAVPQYP